MIVIYLAVAWMCGVVATDLLGLPGAALGVVTGSGLIGAGIYGAALWGER